MTLETALKAPAAEGEEEAEDEDAPKGRVVAFDVSCAAPVANARPLSPEAFAAVKARLRVVEWRHSSTAKPETDAENKRMVASVKRKQASLACQQSPRAKTHTWRTIQQNRSVWRSAARTCWRSTTSPTRGTFRSVGGESFESAGCYPASVLQGLVASRAYASTCCIVTTRQTRSGWTRPEVQ